eukprot:TRINITY_DN29031_c0_g1_i1.p1 TRINITY_DN29031_c0_g1~~TRINITY_DN29031_c0_g1_i1.p1  ORF type:complete len:626 (-),score=59.92 TRINITY_DN29031_c0_g1_i1:46-1923(-)
MLVRRSVFSLYLLLSRCLSFGCALECFSPEMSYSLCCNRAAGARGLQACWNGAFQYESCCVGTLSQDTKLSMRFATSPLAMRRLLRAFLECGPPISGNSCEAGLASTVHALDTLSLTSIPRSVFLERHSQRLSRMTACAAELAISPMDTVVCDFEDLLDIPWIDIIESPWPLFGWLHAAQFSLEQCWPRDWSSCSWDPKRERWSSFLKIMHDTVLENSRWGFLGLKDSGLARETMRYINETEDGGVDECAHNAIIAPALWPNFTALESHVHSIQSTFTMKAKALLTTRERASDVILGWRAPLWLGLQQIQTMFWHWWLEDALALGGEEGFMLSNFVKHAGTWLHGWHRSVLGWVRRLAHLLDDQNDARAQFLFDVGAWCGSGHDCFPQAVVEAWGCETERVFVYGFEADPNHVRITHDYMAQLPAALQECITIHHLAMWNETITDTASLAEGHPMRWLIDDSGKTASDVEIAAISSLDDFLRTLPSEHKVFEEDARIILKIDADGADFEVLQGARRLLASKGELVLVIEYSDQYPSSLLDVVREVDDLGYVGFILGENMLAQLPNYTVMSQMHARKFRADNQEFSISGLLGIWFDVLFVRRSSRLFHELRLDPRLARPPSLDAIH